MVRRPFLRYPFIGESAGFVKHQYRIYIRHHFLLINPGYTLMSSMTFGGGFAGLVEGAAAEGHENQNQQYKGQNHLTNKNALHHFSLYHFLYRVSLNGQRIFFYPGGTKHTTYYKSIIQADIALVKAKKRMNAGMRK
ncbi:MAG: hypothetical protein JXA81_00375 [Sedimentisphaerales bacterium]|nr:hypothetical protein [Sedimentisphaerales bacterium]